MAIRMSGLVSGLDTESLVEELVSAYSYKQESYEKEQTKLEWKKEAWEDLNTQVNTYFKSTLSSMRMSGAYTKQTVEVSDTTKASVSANGNAPLGVQTLSVDNVAKTGYLTGAALGDDITSSSTLADLGYEGDETTIDFTIGDETTQLTVSTTTTISDFISALNSISGVSANYDTNYHRIFITSSTSGVDNDFTILSSDDDSLDAMKKLGIYTESAANNKAYDKWLNGNYEGTSLVTLTKDSDGNVTGYTSNAETVLTKIAEYNKTVSDAESAISEATDDKTAATDAKSTAQTTRDTEQAKIDYAKAYQTVTASGITDDEKTSLLNYYNMSEDDMTEEDKTAYDTLKSTLLSNMNGTLTEEEDGYVTIDDLVSAINTMSSYVDEDDEDSVANAQAIRDAIDSDATTYLATEQAAVDAAQKEMDDQQALIDAAQAIIDAQTTAKEAAETSLEDYSLLTDYLEDDTTKITSDNLSDMVTKLNTKLASVYDLRYNAEYCEGAKKVDAEDATITLNGVEYTSSSNTFVINGLTVTAKAVSDGEMSISTTTDTDGIYSSIKDMFTGFNDLMTKFSKLYNADSARDYDPLTDDEKDAMSDEEIEKWETKIKDALLRNDSTLSSLINLFNNAMSSQVYIKDGKAITYSSSKEGYVVNSEVVAKTESELKSYANANGYTAYSLSNFGCGTLSYFNAADNEHYNIHIDGDPDDGDVSDNTDKLKTMISTDTQTVSAFFSALTSKLYSDINDRMTSTDLNSKYSIYNDKQLDSDIEDVKDEISDWEDKVEDLEDYWYDKFSAMETALSKLQSQESSLSSLMGS